MTGSLTTQPDLLKVALHKYANEVAALTASLARAREENEALKRRVDMTALDHNRAANLEVAMRRIAAAPIAARAIAGMALSAIEAEEAALAGRKA